MRVLHWEFSDRFIEYAEWFRRVSDKRIQFHYTDEHPNPAVHPRQAMVEMQQWYALVYILRDIDPSLAEENAAHELTHLALMDMGYCYPALKNPHRGQWQPVVNGLLSWTSDVLIDRKLEEFGYDNQEYKTMVWENTKQHLEMYPRESEPGQEEIFNALGYFYCYHSIEKDQWAELKELYTRVDPSAARLGDMIIDLGSEQDFFNPEGYCRFLARVRDELQIGDMVEIINPRAANKR